MKLRHVVLLSLVGVVLSTPRILADPTLGQTSRPTSPSSDAAAPAATRGPLVVEAPGDIEISISIVPTDQTKELRVYADSDSYYRSTTIWLNGRESEPIHTFTWRGFPAGDYDVVGMLIDDNGSSEVVVQGALRVIGH